ncbi:hypothetical protein M405DRAFT_931524 [Rhizopogon salebrosus TDB-379]|nr:hypothetical protein M405DRAFT_931524 [Rhizopogon salebrosus TDB-379]
MSIPELRREIFQLVDRKELRKKTLLALAVTCKSFTGPALDLLWRELDSFAPLIRCLPPSLWKLDKLELQFQRAMTSDDWSIFCKYNHRVHSLHMKASPCGVSTEILIALGYPPFSLPLLPNLMSLTWDAPSGIFPYIRSFMTQTLTTLNIHARSEFKFGPSEQSILSFIPTLCPSVSHFHFQDDAELGDTSMALQCWSHLISVTTANISDAAILHLSKLPSLRVLNLGLHPTPITADTQQLLRHDVFCGLQELGVTCETRLAPVDAFFEALSIAPKKLSITYGVDSIGALPDSISRIRDACAHSALEHLQVEVNEIEADFGANSISAATFGPLCAFWNLRSLDFESLYDVQLDDTTLIQMAKAWPLLEVLLIHGKIGQWADHNITPNALVSLLQHCPRLVSVTIGMNWSTVDRCGISSEIPYQGFAHGALSCADFQASTIRHPTRIAAFLSAIAPRLKTIIAWNFDRDVNDPDFDKYLPRWMAVHHLVKVFSLVREQGKSKTLNTGEAVGDVGGSGEDSREDSGSEYISHSDQVSSNSENEG